MDPKSPTSFEVVVPAIIAIVAALLSGGTLGGAVIFIAKRAVDAIIKQNSELTDSILKLGESIKTNHAVAEERYVQRKEQMDKIERSSSDAVKYSREVSEKLRGRL